MSDQLNEPTTQSLEEKITERFDRLESLVVNLASQVAALTSQLAVLQTTVNEIARDLRDMYVDLHRRGDMVKEELYLLRREMHQLVQDRQPESIASRLMG